MILETSVDLISFVISSGMWHVACVGFSNCHSVVSTDLFCCCMLFLAYSYAVYLLSFIFLVNLTNVSAPYWKSLRRKKSTVS